MHPLDLSSGASGPTTPTARPANRQSGGGGEDFEFDRPKSKGGVPLLSIGLLAGASIAGYVLSAQNDFLLGQIASPVLGLLGLHGLWRGGFRKLVMLPVSVGALCLLCAKPDFADPLIRLVGGQSSSVGNGIACVLAFIIVMTIASIVVRVVRKRVILKKPFLRATDRFFGTGIGLAEGAFIVLSVCWAALIVKPQAQMVVDSKDVPRDSFQHQFAGGMLRIADEIDRSGLSSVIGKVNLLESVPGLSEALQGIGSGESPIDLDSIDPQLREAALELIKQGGDKDLGGLVEQYRRDSEARNEAYKQLPRNKTNGK